MANFFAPICKTTEAEIPNVILIVVDDLGLHDLSIEGSTFYRTPNIDKFTGEGMRFTAGYANCCVCSPSRASIMLGQFTARHGITNWIGAKAGADFDRNEPLLNADYVRQLQEDQTTIAEAMREAGYQTFFAGKWHLGGEGSLPTDHGFDINIGGSHKGHPPTYFSPYRNSRLTDGPNGESLTLRLAAETSQFIREQSKAKDAKPYFAMLSFYTVHSPVQTTKELTKKYQAVAPPAPADGQRFEVDRTLPVRQIQDHPVYAGMIETLDVAVGEVLKAIDESGKSESTIVIFTSDNGGLSSGDTYSTANLPLRGGKGRQWEGGIRVPFYIRHPKTVKANSTCDLPVIGSDIYPTVLELCGIKTKPEQHVDGQSLAKVLVGDADQQLESRPLFWHYPHWANQGGEPSSLVRWGNYKLIHYHLGGRNELYHLPSDQSEQKDLAAEQPERTAKMAAKLTEWLESVDAKMAIPDARYNAEVAKEKWARMHGSGKKRLETTHAAYLDPEWQPNENWWGSFNEKSKSEKESESTKVNLEQTPEQNVSFNRDVRPLLSNRCFACHGPDAETREAGLRFDLPNGDEGAIGYAIEPGSIKESEMWNRITSDDEDDVMPPADSHLEPFSKDELDLIKRWIESGAKYENFWAFEKPKKSAMPKVENKTWSTQLVDLHVLKKLESLGMTPSAEADARTLIRRITFDLTGLPPTRTEIADFIKQFEVVPDQAWEQLVDRLLERPQYGEHIGRYWLDLVRFADSNGMHKDFYRNHVPYRDWVIRAFNENLGYDNFVRYQLAGDLYLQPTNDQLIASGFHRLHLIIDKGTALPEESFAKNVTDRVTSVSTAFMGLTVQCAQCHDHKFDPILQKDFYSLSAFFNNIDAAPETVSGPGSKQGFQKPYVSLGGPEAKAKLQEFANKIEKLKSKQKAESSDGEEAFAQKLKSLVAMRDKFDATLPKAMVMRERSEVRQTFVLERGQYNSPGDEVQRNTPGFLHPLKTKNEIPSRMDLANWFVDPENPLTARVAVNRVWQQFFGVGLVKTSEDFGSQGSVPSHPQLLDDLAISFVESGWDFKLLIKQIVMSKTYRQSSVSTPKEFQTDAENRLLARGSRYRLDAEMIRDQILATSGLLSDKMFGPSVKPPQPEGLWKAVSMIGETYQADSGEAIRRRSLYTFWKRSMPPPQMTILNAPFRDACIARRERTNTPTQALLLLNESEYLKAAQQLAAQVVQQPADQRIEFAWETVTAQLPDEKEVAVLSSLLKDLRNKYADNPKLVAEMFTDMEPSANLSSPEFMSDLAAWTILVNTLYNLDITKTRD